MPKIADWMRSAIAFGLTLTQVVVLEGKQPPFQVNPWGYLALAFGALMASSLGTHWILSQNDPILYPLLGLMPAIRRVGMKIARMAARHPSGTEATQWVAHFLQIAFYASGWLTDCGR